MAARSFRSSLALVIGAREALVFYSIANSSYMQHAPYQKEEQREHNEQKYAESIRLSTVNARTRYESPQYENCYAMVTNSGKSPVSKNRKALPPVLGC